MHISLERLILLPVCLVCEHLRSNTLAAPGFAEGPGQRPMRNKMCVFAVSIDAIGEIKTVSTEHGYFVLLQYESPQVFY